MTASSHAGKRDVLQGEATSGVFEDMTLFEGWDRDYYPPQAKPYYDRAVRRMLQGLACPPGEPVLDAGCGLAEHSIRIAREGLSVVAIDVSQPVLREAQRRATVAGVAERISFRPGDLTHLDFADESFSSIFSWGVVIHIRAIEKALDELVRILRPKGRLALYVTNQAALDHRVLRAARAMLRKPPARYEELELGRGRWHDNEGGPLWVWHMNVPALVAYLDGRGLTLLSRMAGEFTELQRRAHGPLRAGLLWLNRAYSRLRLPAGPCADNLLIFEKRN